MKSHVKLHSEYLIDTDNKEVTVVDIHEFECKMDFETVGLLCNHQYIMKSPDIKYVDGLKGISDMAIQLANGHLLIPGEIYLINDIIKNGLYTQEIIELTYFNKYFNYGIVGDFVFLVDSDRVREGIWHIPSLLTHGMPNWTEDYKYVGPTRAGGIMLSQNKYPHLKGEHVGMGFTKSEYKRFLAILQESRGESNESK